MKYMVEYTHETESPEPEYHTARDWDTAKRHLLKELSASYDTQLIGASMCAGTRVEYLPNPNYDGPYKEQQP